MNKVKALVLTHAHWDHVSGRADVGAGTRGVNGWAPHRRMVTHSVSWSA